MDFFVNEEQRKASRSSFYLEFQKGSYQDKCWLPDSISIYADLWDRFHLSDLVCQAIKEFDYYGITVVTGQQWAEIVKTAQRAGGIWEKVIEDVIPWVDDCFKEHDVFTILGI